MKTQFDNAKSLFDSGDYLKAFEAFTNIVNNPISSKEEVSDAYNMLGVLVLIDPTFSPNDESGFIFFAKSLEYNPHNADALINIIGGFGTSVSSHRDIKMLDFALERLKESPILINKQDEKMITERIKLRDEITKRGL